MLWYLFVAGNHLKIPIWKIDVEGVADLSPADYSLVCSVASAENLSTFENFYCRAYNSSWPMGVSLVYHNQFLSINFSCQCSTT